MTPYCNVPVIEDNEGWLTISDHLGWVTYFAINEHAPPDTGLCTPYMNIKARLVGDLGSWKDAYFRWRFGPTFT